MTIRSTKPRFGLVRLFTPDSVDDFTESIADTIDRQAWNATGLPDDQVAASRRTFGPA